MYAGKIIFSQVIDHLPMHTFRRCVRKYQGNFKMKSYTCLVILHGIFLNDLAEVLLIFFARHVGETRP